jgi:hypothetical protein
LIQPGRNGRKPIDPPFGIFGATRPYCPCPYPQQALRIGNAAAAIQGMEGVFSRRRPPMKITAITAEISSGLLIALI